MIDADNLMSATDDEYDEFFACPEQPFLRMEYAFVYALERLANITQSRPSDMGWVDGKYVPIDVDPTATIYLATDCPRNAGPTWRLHREHRLYYWREDP